MKTEPELRHAFAAYFLDLKASMAKDGGRVGKSEEWDRFVEHQVDEGMAPEEARTWKCPRSLEAEFKR